MTESNEKMLQPELTLTLDPFSEPAPQMQTAQPEPPMAQEQSKPAFDVTELKNFEEEEDKGFFGFFKKNTNKLNTMKAKYAKAETNINQIVQGLENQMVVLLKDVAMLDKMYEINKTYF